MIDWYRPAKPGSWFFILAEPGLLAPISRAFVFSRQSSAFKGREIEWRDQIVNEPSRSNISPEFGSSMY
jgi:hypothetical protein